MIEEFSHYSGETEEKVLNRLLNESLKNTKINIII